MDDFRDDPEMLRAVYLFVSFRLCFSRRFLSASTESEIIIVRRENRKSSCRRLVDPRVGDENFNQLGSRDGPKSRGS